MIIKNNYFDLKALIFDIQGLSVHDGPGCRTLIFFCGCTLNCFWCSNPEGLSLKLSLLHYKRKCITCESCIKNCSHNAIFLKSGKIHIKRELCSKCTENTCIKECYTEALKLCGYEITLNELIKIINRDRQYWGKSGGITLTGGEPLLQIDFIEKLLYLCYNDYIHTAIETCGNVQWNNFLRVLSYLDWIFYDLKHINPQIHKNATGADNTLILENAKKLASEFKGRLIFRLPVIPGFNDDNDNIENTAKFLNDIGAKEINILPLHHLGREKYNLLDKEYLAAKYPVPDKKTLSKISEKFLSQGIKCYIGSNTPF